MCCCAASAATSGSIVRRAGIDKRPIVRLEGIEDRSTVDALRGASLVVPREAAPALPEGEWWAHELEGCAVLDGERRVQGLGDAFGGGDGVEARRAVPEVEGEGVGGHARCRADLDRAGIAHRLGGLFQHGLQALGEFGVGRDDKARRSFDLARQGFQGRADRGLREGVQGGRGDAARAAVVDAINDLVSHGTPSRNVR